MDKATGCASHCVRCGTEIGLTSYWDGRDGPFCGHCAGAACARCEHLQDELATTVAALEEADARAELLDATMNEIERLLGIYGTPVLIDQAIREMERERDALAKRLDAANCCTVTWPDGGTCAASATGLDGWCSTCQRVMPYPRKMMDRYAAEKREAERVLEVWRSGAKQQIQELGDERDALNRENERLREWQCYWLLEQMREAWGMYPGQQIGVSEIEAFLLSRAAHKKSMPKPGTKNGN